MIVCGWCGSITAYVTCSACGRDPALPWIQRNQLPPTEAEAKRTDARQRIAQARRELGADATVEQIATRMGVSDRTVRRWQEMSDPRPSMPPQLT